MSLLVFVRQTRNASVISADETYPVVMVGAAIVLTGIALGVARVPTPRWWPFDVPRLERWGERVGVAQWWVAVVTMSFGAIAVAVIVVRQLVGSS